MTIRRDPRPVRLGVQIAPQHASYATIRTAVAGVEALGVDVVFNWDHFFPLSGEPDGLHFESWSLLAAWAEQTTTIQLGALVNCNSYRNADLQADMARTIDHISGGRFLFGTGAGWFERDYDEYGYEFGTPGTRLDALESDLQRIEARWARLNPPPTRDIPILIGGGGEKKTLRIVAKHADIWHSFSTPDVMKHKLGVLDGWCAKVGRDMSDIEISTELRSRTTDEADALYDLGTRLFTLGLSGPHYDLSPVVDWLAWRDSKNAS
ncbi:LLM class F420-dependent oxidoreductase [Glaciibacter psychrotolerans]|uniref:Putative F420-dependent oxidoreductase n=1 Tax=Glaciibacter psychrotolerans TaxID=670054 RepID=A0A7Z0EEG6_9MICO|nr:LLM class F420-dependent oxidoreductase [Leifsonia psychrotolerans]NYJ19454.1 putative F420-dependent oxidoreductase [Leifsonia psychrotolerans]